jgi:hypothetical protein
MASKLFRIKANRRMPIKLTVLRQGQDQFLLSDTTSSVTLTLRGTTALEVELAGRGVSLKEILRTRSEFAAGRATVAVDVATPQEKRINGALAELGRRRHEPKEDYCPRCGVFDWNVDILDIPANSLMARPALPTGSYRYTQQPTGFISTLSLVCKNCGFMIFHNMDVLGQPK